MKKKIVYWVVGILVVLGLIWCFLPKQAEAVIITPSVEEVETADCSVTLKFVNVTNSRAQFEYRIDGEADNQFPAYFQEFIGVDHPVVGGLVYPQITLDNRSSAVSPLVGTTTIETFAVDSLIEVRLALGGERDWDFDWVSFETTCPTPVVVSSSPEPVAPLGGGRHPVWVTDGDSSYWYCPQPLRVEADPLNRCPGQHVGDSAIGTSGFNGLSLQAQLVKLLQELIVLLQKQIQLQS